MASGWRERIQTFDGGVSFGLLKTRSFGEDARAAELQQMEDTKRTLKAKAARSASSGRVVTPAPVAVVQKPVVSIKSGPGSKRGWGVLPSPAGASAASTAAAKSADTKH